MKNSRKSQIVVIIGLAITVILSYIEKVQRVA